MYIYVYFIFEESCEHSLPSFKLCVCCFFLIWSADFNGGEEECLQRGRGEGMREDWGSEVVGGSERDKPNWGNFVPPLYRGLKREGMVV